MQTDSTSLAVHEVAGLFPAMAQAEFAELVRDIGEHGLREPIWLHEDKIIDGRHRLKACHEAGITPRFQEWDGHGSLVSFVVSLNLKRRHLTASQKAFIAVDLLPMLEAEARQRQGERSALTSVKSFTEVKEPQRAAQEAAALVGSNYHYVSDAKRIKGVAPDVAEAGLAGVVTVPQAKQLERLAQEDREQVLDRVVAGAEDFNRAYRRLAQRARAATVAQEVAPLTALGQFPILYADPPWRYDEGSTTPSRHIENHYPTLSLEELCALPVAEVSQDNALLFLWATSPKLMEAGAVLRAWGFEYRTSLVWVKDCVGMGAWVRSRHELLLIGRRGTWPTPVDAARPDSVLSAPRRQHSQKPTEVYALIETMYPQVPRLELFARGTPRPGWQVWGNEFQPHAAGQSAADEPEE